MAALKPARQSSPADAEPSVGSNRRAQERSDFTTVALIVPSTGPVDASSIQRCWTRDLSASGACLVSDQQLPDTFVLQLLLPEFEDRLIRAEVVSHRTETVVTLDGTRERHIYGVKFAGFLR